MIQTRGIDCVLLIELKSQVKALVMGKVHTLCSSSRQNVASENKFDSDYV